MPFKDTPGLRRIAAVAIELRDVVRVRVLPHEGFLMLESRVVRPGETVEVQRRLAESLVADGRAELVE